MRLEKNQSRLFDRQFMLMHFNDSLPSRLNIYDQAMLTYISLKQDVSHARFFKKSTNEIGVVFQLQGELKGIVVSLINIHGIEISNDKLINLQSLHVECMNIFLGHYLTKLEAISGIMGVISAPRILKKRDTLPKAITSFKAPFQIAAQYSLKTAEKSYPCDLYILTDTCNISEV